MKQIWSFLFFGLFIFKVFGQHKFGFGASIHRYDQVLCIKAAKPFAAASLGVDFGLGVERSLQGALAPQFAFFWQSPLFKTDRHYPCNRPFLACRFQFDLQRSSITAVNYALYLGLGYPIGKAQRWDIQLSLGGVYEKMYGALPVQLNGVPIFFNSQAQLNFYLFDRKNEN